CITCHDSMDDKPSVAFRSDVHKAAGVSCADCHGGDRRSDDMEAAMSKSKGFIGVPKGNAIAEACGKCHDDEARMRKTGFTGETGQLAALRASAHSFGTKPGDELILQCSTCHGAHGIRRHNDPASPVSPLRVVALCSSCHSNPDYMRRFNPSLATDQAAKYRTSMHGQKNATGDVRVATCASCHTGHNIKPAVETTSSVNAFNIPATCGHCHSDAERMKPYGIPTTQVRDYTTSVHGKALLEKHDASAPSCNDCHGNHGAAPPNVESISNVCGTCHALNAELFRQSRHKVEFDRMGKPECETCHGNHGVQPATQAMFGFDAAGVCGKCHGPDRAPVGYKTAMKMRSMLDSLVGTIALAGRRIDEAEQKGMEVDDIRFALRDANQARLQSRTAVHAFNLEEFSKVIDPGLRIASTSLKEADEANDEYVYRRIGLAVVTLIITLTIILLFFFIRAIEKKQAAA
ncbi:MAG: ammonia-forming cytochrome c nitrite reductase subunit c552, partial [Bacteroidetes bacterium]|nr:ammonia-forming cytochrome c nitrite reductase subunit c552 [Bacteroidota bacterium]